MAETKKKKKNSLGQLLNDMEKNEANNDDDLMKMMMMDENSNNIHKIFMKNSNKIANNNNNNNDNGINNKIKTTANNSFNKSSSSSSSMIENSSRVKKQQFSLGVLLIKLIIWFYDLITLPFYYIIQKPWIKIQKNNAIRAKLQNPNDPYSSYIHLSANYEPNHYIFKAKTIPEARQLAYRSNPKDLPMIGRRKIIDLHTEIDFNGKKLLKYNLTDYEWFNNEEIEQIITDLSNGFLMNGVKFQEKVVIYAETRMEWLLCAHAIWRIGAIVTTLYSTLGIKSIQQAIDETKVEHIITTMDLLPNLKTIIDKLEFIRKIYIFDGAKKSDLSMAEADLNEYLRQQQQQQKQQQQGQEQNRFVQLISYDELQKNGHKFYKNNNNNISDDRKPKPNDICVLLYTSGSTGNPKGVIYTHQNLMAASKSFAMHVYDYINEPHIYYAMLPLAHTFELTVEISVMTFAWRIGYGSPLTITDNSTAIISGQKGDLTSLKPTIICAVPLLLDRIRRALTDRFERKSSLFLKQLLKFCIEYKNYWIDHGYDTPLFNKLICSKLNKNLGGNIHYAFSGGAPLSNETHRFMRALFDLKIFAGYGTTETCSVACVTDLEDYSVGNVGPPTHGVQIRLIDWPEGGYFVRDKPYSRGEIVIGAENVAHGYYQLPDKDLEAFEYRNGIKWFLTGDIGQVDERGVFKVIDRKKDLIKLQYGEYVSLGKIEAELKNFTYIENVCIYGDSMNTYVIALIQPQKSSLEKLAKQIGKSDETFEQLCNDNEINQIILEKIKEFCLEVGLNKMEIPKKIKLVIEEWSLDNGFLTTSLKIKRREIEKYYKKLIKNLYDDENDGNFRQII